MWLRDNKGLLFCKGSDMVALKALARIVGNLFPQLLRRLGLNYSQFFFHFILNIVKSWLIYMSIMLADIASTRLHLSSTSNVVQHFDHVLHHFSLSLRLKSIFHQLLNMVARVTWYDGSHSYIDPKWFLTSLCCFLSSEIHHLKVEIRDLKIKAWNQL